MGYQPIEELLDQANGSAYKLVRMASIRALELADGKPALVSRVSTDKLTTLALTEIREKKVVAAEVADQFKPEEKTDEEE